VRLGATVGASTFALAIYTDLIGLVGMVARVGGVDGGLLMGVAMGDEVACAVLILIVFIG